ncbi:MAG: DUF6188 family protein [Thermoleophilia bacterium]
MESNNQFIKFPIIDKEVTRVFLDAEFGLEFWTPEEMVTLRIGSSFKLSNDTRKVITPGNPEELAPALSLFGKKVTSARATCNGSLDISFSDNRQLHVDPDPKYEAW